MARVSIPSRPTSLDPDELVGSIQDTIKSISAGYHTIETIRDLPKAFNVVKGYLPLVLESISRDGKPSGHEDSRLLLAILEKATKLERVFEDIKNKCKDEAGAKAWATFRATYHIALRGQMVSSVEQLMTDILVEVRALSYIRSSSSDASKPFETATQALSKIHPSIPETDVTQYAEYASILTPEQRNFPVSEKSVESQIFIECLSGFIKALQQTDTKWQTIDCLGRIWPSKDSKLTIRTTVVVAFFPMPDEDEMARLKTTLEGIMGDEKLRVEFVQGRVTSLYDQNSLELREPQSPLVCGASCAPKGKGWTGTIGGFITITGDPDKGAVYAVTNHHVVEDEPFRDYKQPIAWLSMKSMGQEPPTTSLRRICGRLDRIPEWKKVEHPSRKDRRDRISRLKSEEEWARDYCENFEPGKNARPGHQKDSEVELHHADADVIKRHWEKLEEHSNSRHVIVGITWASSGRKTWKIGDDTVRQDWALVKLFQGKGQEFHNTINNSLRPGQPVDQFRAVVSWSGASAIDVCKRGRTTNHTVGRTNGVPSVENCGGGIQMTKYSVLSTSSNPYFSLPGDSGAWLMDRTGKLVGMMFAGRTEARRLGGVGEGRVVVDQVEKITYFTPADYLFQMIQEKFEKDMRKLGIELSETFEPGQRINLH